MSNEKHETIADIVDEIRERLDAVYPPGYCKGDDEDEVVRTQITRFLDRIEAAYKWEHDWFVKRFSAMSDFCVVYRMVYPDGDKDVPAALEGAFENMTDVIFPKPEGQNGNNK